MMLKRQRIRSRRRYIAVKVDSDQMLDDRDLYDAVLKSILQLFGEYGASQTEFVLIEYDSQMKQAILRCSHRGLNMVKASVAAVTEIKNGKATVHILLVSGTLKALRRKILG